MRYFANPSTPRVREAMTAGLLGCIVTPRQGNKIPEGAVWCADNGLGPGRGKPGDSLDIHGGLVSGKGQIPDPAWWEWLSSLPHLERCAFAVAPDVVGNARASHLRSAPWLSKIRGLGVPAAYVAQDGLEKLPVPWHDFDVLFIGGTDAFKLGAWVREVLCPEALSRGKSIHMGRVNSLKRTRYAVTLGCSSADGTIVSIAPDRRLPEVLGWVRDAVEQGRFEGVA